MKNLNFLKLFFGTILLIATATFVSCVDDNDDTEAPFLEVSPTSLIFTTDGVPAEGSQASFEILTNRHWTATVKDDKSWVTLSATEGDGSATIQVSIPEGINDEANIDIQISNKVGPLMTETVKITSGNIVPAMVIYKETFGAGDKKPDDKWYYVDEYTGWDKSGDGATDVKYEGSGASIRNNGSTSSGYDGASGDGKLFFGANANFIIKNITLADGQTNLKITFGGAYYEYDTKDNVFKPELLHFYLSTDGITWSNALSYETKDINNKDGWIFATSNFTLKNPTSTLYIKYLVDKASVFSIDDVTLSTGNGGQIIDMEGSTPPEPGETKAITIPELIEKMSTTQTPVDATADRVFEAVVQSNTEGGNYTANNLVLATEGANTAGNGITLFGSQVDPAKLQLTQGDKVKVILYKGLAKTVNYNGMYEVTGAQTDEWAKVEKIGTAEITPVIITADKLLDYQGMTVTIQKATPENAGIWGSTNTHSFTAGGITFAVFCKETASAFANQPFVKTESDITGLAAVYKNNGQLVPRNLQDVIGFNSTDPTITKETPSSVNFPVSGGIQTLEVEIINQGNNTLSVDGLSGILSATVNGSQIIVTAEANNSENTINQTLLISLTNGNTFTVPVKVAPVGDSDGYTLISTLEALSAGRYLMAGYAEKNNDNVDLTPYTYQMWTGAISSNDAEAKSNSDLITSAYQYANNQLTPQNASELATTEVELIAVSGKANTYYIKVGDKYLYNSVNATNRRLYFKETTDEAEWVFANKSNGTGVVASNNATYLMTASANSNYLRSYKKETQTKAGIFFFKKE